MSPGACQCSSRSLSLHLPSRSLCQSYLLSRSAYAPHNGCRTHLPEVFQLPDSLLEVHCLMNVCPLPQLSVSRLLQMLSLLPRTAGYVYIFPCSYLRSPRISHNLSLASFSVFQTYTRYLTYPLSPVRIYSLPNNLLLHHLH